VGYADKSDCMTNSYSISRCTWKWMKKLFHLLDVSILNSFILLTSCSAELSHQDFRLALVRDLIQERGGCLNHRPPHGEDQLLPPVNLPECSMKSKETRTEFRCSKMQCGVVCWSLFQGVPHTVTFLKIVWHYVGKSRTQNARTVYCY
jgi:hypothetical protein